MIVAYERIHTFENLFGNPTDERNNLENTIYNSK